MLVFPKSKDQCVQNKAEIRNKLCASLLLKSRKRTAERRGEKNMIVKLGLWDIDLSLAFCKKIK